MFRHLWAGLIGCYLLQRKPTRRRHRSVQSKSLVTWRVARHRPQCRRFSIEGSKSFNISIRLHLTDTLQCAAGGATTRTDKYESTEWLNTWFAESDVLTLNSSTVLPLVSRILQSIIDKDGKAVIMRLLCVHIDAPKILLWKYSSMIKLLLLRSWLWKYFLDRRSIFIL